MNDQIVKLFGVIVLLFALLVLFTSRWTVFSAAALNRNPLNSRQTIAQEKIRRGAILADDGQVLAHSVPHGGGTWRTTYPGGSLYAQTVGYWRGSGDDAGLELYYARELQGTTSTVNSVFGPLSSHVDQGNALRTTLDPRAMQAAARDLDGRVGSVVALDPRTGAVLAMYSNPTYDQADPNHDCVDACQVDRAVNSAYPPGSTFKVVTSTAAINTGRYSPGSEVDGSSPARISGTPLANDAGDPPYGEVTLTEALTQSINTAWARVGLALGTPVVTDYMKRYGFYSRPPIDLPAAELRASNVISPAGANYPAGSPDEDIGRIAIGQGGLAVTPLQMAMVASAVADGGRLMVPHLAASFQNSSGQTVRTIRPRLYRRVMSTTSAAEINQMMRTVVDEGTGQAAQLGSIPFAGKTGTASVGPDGENLTQPWFIGFAPANDPRVAVAVDIERTDDGYGGQVAAPIARDVVQTLLGEGR